MQALEPLEKARTLSIENSTVRILVEEKTGLIRSVVFKAKNLDLFKQFRLPGQAGALRVFDEKDQIWYEDLTGEFEVSQMRAVGTAISYTKRFAGAPFTLDVKLVLESEFLHWEVKARKASPGVADRSLRVHFCLPLINGWDLWAPCAAGQRAFDGMTPFEHCYLQISYMSLYEVILPMVSHFNQALDIGYSVLEPIDSAVPAAKFAFNNADTGFTWRHQPKLAELPKLETINYFIGLVGDRPMRTKVMVHFHEGHWRPALGAVFNRWKEYFVPANPRIYELEGMFGGSCIHTHHLPAKEWARLQAKLFEVHGHFSFYGDYYQDGQDHWPDVTICENVRKAAIDAGKPMTPEQIFDFVRNKPPEEVLALIGKGLKRLSFPDGKPSDAPVTGREAFDRVNISRQLVRRVVEELADAGVHPFWYFNYTDGFRPVVEKLSRSSISRMEDGSDWPSGWMMCSNMNGDPDLPFGQFTIESARKIIAEHPKLKGFFLDCFRHFEVDFAHDDGVTVVNGRPAYSINFSYDRIENLIGKMRVDANLCSFANKPQTVRSMRWVDGMMIEGDGDQAELKYFWSCLAKPIIDLWTSDRAPDDENCRRAVVYGCFPKVSLDSPQDHARRLRYLPLYEQFRRRVFCFEPDPLRVPRGCRGELYTVGEDYVAGIANIHASDDMEVRYTKAPHAMFRVARGADVGKVGVIYPGMKEMRIAQARFNGTFLAVPLEGFTTAAVVRLFVTGRSGKPIGPDKFQGPIDSCGDPDSAFTDLSQL